MVINRPTYLDQLIDARGNGMIKIVTGIRRCGKSFLLGKLFAQWLQTHIEPSPNIIHIALDDLRNKELLDPLNLLNHIETKIDYTRENYIILDEVQMVDDFVGTLNSLLHFDNIDVYVTGSNSRFLSKDVATEFRGRGDEIHMWPLSFAELYNGIGGDIYQLWKEYYTYGGLPQILTHNSPEKKRKYLNRLTQSVYVRDIFERYDIRNPHEFKELIQIIASAIGTPVNPTKLSNTFKSEKHIAIDRRTISSYMDYMEDAFLIEKSIRYDIKGKKYINTLNKFYFSDMGLRNALLGFRQIEEPHIMENVIYNTLRQRGMRVDVGEIEKRVLDKNGKTDSRRLEVDFVADAGNRLYYIQSALALPDEQKMAQETASLRQIKDSYTKVIITRENVMPYRDNNGIIVVGLFDFLLKEDCLNSL